MPVPATSAPTPKPTLSLIEQLQTSALKLVSDEEIANHYHSENVAIYGDTAIFGAPNNDGGRGSVFVFTRQINGEWTQQAKLVAYDRAANNQFGRSVGIFGDTVVVGSNLDGSDGEVGGWVHLFVRNRNTWRSEAQFAIKLVPPEGGTFMDLRFNVGIFGDTVVVGAHGDGGESVSNGSVNIFVRDGINWAHQAQLAAPDESGEDLFGSSVAIFGDTVIVGAYGDVDNGAGSGAVYLFTRNGVTWSRQAKLVAPDGAANDQFGSSVGIFDDAVVIGAPGNVDNEVNIGSIHVFIRSEVAWIHQVKLVAPNGAAGDLFGKSVGISGDTIIASAHGGGAGEESASTHVFARNGITWSHVAMLFAPKDEVEFGQSVAIYNNTAVVGSESGEVYVFSA